MTGEAFFERDGDRFVPSDGARGPWDPGTLHGRVVAGLIARAVERDHGDPDLHYARMTVDLFRPPPFAPLEVRTSVARDGNRIRVVDGTVTAEGVEIARGSIVMLRRAEQPAGTVWSPPPWDVPPPEEIEPPRRGAGGDFVPIWETRPITQEFGGVEQKRVWLRETRPLVAGEAPTPFLRAALAADFTNPFANSGDGGLNFVNADITLYLHRLPEGEWLGFEVAGHHSAQGIAVAECAIYDVGGAVGRSIVCAVANQHRR